jgi:hypothetical protein
MFLNGEIYSRLVEDLSLIRADLADERQRSDLARCELAAERGRREILTRQAAVHESFVEFLCARVNQLETERVLLLRQLTTIEIPAPVINLRPMARMPPPADDPTAVSIFDDDASHAPKGWHPDGSVNYGDDVHDPRRTTTT